MLQAQMTQLPGAPQQTQTNSASIETLGMSFSTLMAHFQAPNAWIVDSGVTPHITCFPNFLYNFKNLSNKFVLLYNQTCVQVVGTGTVKLNSFITLHNVLYIPSFHVNLISVLKSTTNCHIGVYFATSFVTFQATQSLKTIGRGDLHNEIFLLYTEHTHSKIVALVHLLNHTQVVKILFLSLVMFLAIKLLTMPSGIQD